MRISTFDIPGEFEHEVGGPRVTQFRFVQLLVVATYVGFGFARRGLPSVRRDLWNYFSRMWF